MNLASAVELYAGGPGSGCNPEKGKCGRPKGSGTGVRKENSVSRALEPFLRLEESSGMETIYGRFHRAGYAMSPASLLPAEDKYIKKVVRSTGCDPEIKQCYMNAQKMMMYDFNRKLQYHEGYIEVSGVPIPHSWVSINGKVVDVTMAALKRDAPEFYKGGHKDYWGVDIDRRDMMDHLFKTKTYSPLTETKKYNLKYLGPLRRRTKE